MHVSGHAVKAFFVALLFLSMTAAVSAQSIAELKKQAAAGDAKAQYNLGVSYVNGEGVARDEAEAVRWFRKAAEQGYVKAQYNLGAAYATGRGVPKDEAEAYFWLNLGASALDEEVRSARDQVGRNLTPEKRQEIQERCRKWVETHPQNRE